MPDPLDPVRLPATARPTVNAADYPKSLHKALEHAHGTDDPVYAAAPTLRSLTPEVRARAEGWWLPEGHHYDLHIEHRPLESAGQFTGGGNKWPWHITVSNWNTVDAMWTVLRDKRAGSHLLIGGRVGLKHPVVIQMIPFNQAGRALAHPFGPETNRADGIQVEICATVADVPRFDENERYKAFANLVRLVNITVPDRREVERVLARKFTDTRRFGGQEYVDMRGHHGHMHVPGNDHGDPTTAFQGSRLIGLLERMPQGGYEL